MSHEREPTGGLSSRTCLASACLLALALCLTAVAGVGQAVPNDTCDDAINNNFVVNLGANAGFTNVGASASGVVPSCAGTGIVPINQAVLPVDVWFFFTAPATGAFSFDLQGTGLGLPILAAYDGNGYSGAGFCGTLPELACAPIPLGGQAMSLSVNVGDLVFLQVLSLLPGDIGPIVVNVHQDFILAIDAPAGSGSIALTNSGGLPGSPYLTAVTFQPGAFPSGWFFGVDIPVPALLSEVSFGVPFFGALDASGGSNFSVPAGIPSGLTIYAVSVQLDPVFGIPVGNSPPITFTTL